MVAKEPVHLDRVIGVRSVNRAQDVDVHPAPAQGFPTAHDLIKAPGTALVDAVGVVHFLWAVYAETDEKVVLLEERAPFIVQEGAVGLYRVKDFLRRLSVFFEVSDGAPEEIEAHEGRLAALPCDVDFAGRVRLQKLPDICIQQVLGHPEPVARVKHFLGQKEAILAVQIAGSARGLGQKVKRPGNNIVFCSMGCPLHRKPDVGCRRLPLVSGVCPRMPCTLRSACSHPPCSGSAALAQCQHARPFR